jgi:hypothetical protein
VNEKIFSVSETIVFAIEKIFSFIETIVYVVDTMISVTGSIFSVAEKIVGEALATLLTRNTTVYKEVYNSSTYSHCGWTSNPNSRTAHQHGRHRNERPNGEKQRLHKLWSLEIAASHL